MRNIRLRIEYDGSNYSGWQSQKNSTAMQDIIEDAIERLTGKRSRLIGASRTDAGVHAKGQVANFKSETGLSLKSIKDGLNGNLPADIIVTRADEADENFHSQYDAKSKHYRYLLTTHKPVSVFYKNFVAYADCRLNIEAMRNEAKRLLGRHDFSSFASSNSRRRSSIRSIHRLDIRKKGRLIYFEIEADGFLYNMARAIVGTLVDVGRGHLKEGSVEKILKGRDRRLAGATAPAKGLCLMKARY